MSKDKGKWLCCLHCERAYQSQGEDGECPFCGASTFMDGWPWKDWKQGHPEYPKVPEEGKTYPMY